MIIIKLEVDMGREMTPKITVSGETITKAKSAHQNYFLKCISYIEIHVGVHAS